jgi:hypothetical protein
MPKRGLPRHPFLARFDIHHANDNGGSEGPPFEFQPKPDNA